MLSRSTPSFSTLVGILAAHWVASVWKMISRPPALSMAPIAGMSLMVPISLLAHMRETRMVSSRSAALTMSAVITPSAGGSRNVTSKPSFWSRLQGSSTALCSMALVMMCPRHLPEPAGFFSYINAAPRSARLFDSVAPDVKMISLSVAPTTAATCSRAASTAASASQPKLWLRLPGLPNFSVK